ncbi:hypothetical protein FXO38_09086 [Capsicum annuum]|nr:hypothetical protein FXO38_09086 [Capsicum annuum]
MGGPLKDKGKQVDESTDRKAARKGMREEITPKENYERYLMKDMNRSNKDEDLWKKKAVDEAAGVSTSSAPARGPIPDPVPIKIPLSQEEFYLRKPTSIGVNVCCT